jgi:hypothetical protein
MSLKRPEEWIDECNVAISMKYKFGVTAAFDYVVAEKLLNFVSLASNDPDYARALPRFVYEVRQIFTPDEMGSQIARIELERGEQKNMEFAEGAPARFILCSPIAPELAAQIANIMELLTETALGTS